MYTDFAQVYDGLMRGVDYAAWAAHYLRLLRLSGVPDGAKILECACGTGNLTLLFAQAGLRVTGTDLSEAMLAEAMRKARAKGLTVPFVKMDMRALKTPRRVDAVLAACDGFNYLLTEKDAERFFLSARECLKPGGALIFDLSTPHKLTGTPANALIVSDDAEIPFIWKNRVRGNTVDMALSVFFRDVDGRYARLEERQRQRAWTRREIKALLQKTGFTDIRATGNLRLSPPRAEDDRWHIAARKVYDS